MGQLKKILINATNLNEGGGVQVATSFLKDLVSLNLGNDLEFSAFVSAAVDRNIEQKSFDKNFFIEYRIVEAKEISFINSYKLNDYDVVFTIFGPIFLPFFRKKHISGFAQPWIINQENEVYIQLKILRRLFFKIKYYLQFLIFAQCKILIVESNYIKLALIKRGYIGKIYIVNNAISSIFHDQKKWSNVNLDVIKKFNDNFIIGTLSGSYEHKNLIYIFKLATKLEITYPNKFKFILTIKNHKFDQLQKILPCDSVVNIGPINLTQCPDFYNKVDAIFLPSLLECFSVTPLESLFMNKIIFVSDRDFFKMYCQGNVKYFDPIDVDSGVEILKEWFFQTNLEKKKEFLVNSRNFAISFGNSKDKINKYIKIIKDELV